MPFVLFNSWIKYKVDLLYAPTPPAAPNTSRYRLLLTNGLTIDRQTSKAEIICAELLPTNGYNRRLYAPGTGGDSGTWDSSQLRYEVTPVAESISFTDTAQWSAAVLLADAPLGTIAKSFVSADVNASTNRIAWTAHGLTGGTEICVTTDNALPGGLATNTIYYAQAIDANGLVLHSTAALNSPIDLTNGGTGTHYLRVATGRLNWYENFSSTQSAGTGGFAALRAEYAEMNVGDINGV